MADTAIEWADRVWNPTTGCDRVSPGCDHCYALTMAKRLKGMGSAKYQRDGDPRTSGPGFAATYHSGEIGRPLRWRKPERIFVNSMSDLFHDRIPDVFIARVWEVMARCPQHTFMILTKRHARMRSLLSDIRFESRVSEFLISQGHVPAIFPLPNVWLGVSAENQQWADIRIPALLDTSAAVRFVSAEPLLGTIDLYKSWRPKGPELDWVITGGESGPGARPMDPQWARSIRDQCQAAGVAFLHKQNGEWAPTGSYGIGAMSSRHVYGSATQNWPRGYTAHEILLRVGKKAAGRELDGRTWDEYPQVAVNV